MSLSEFHHPMLSLGPSFFSKFVTIEKSAISQAFKIMPLSRPWIFSYVKVGCFGCFFILFIRSYSSSLFSYDNNSLSTRGAYYQMAWMPCYNWWGLKLAFFHIMAFLVLHVCGDNGWVAGDSKKCVICSDFRAFFFFWGGLYI